MSARSVSVAQGVAYQCTRKLIRLPPKLLPSLLLPLFMFAAFGGALGAVGSTRGFGYYNYTAFVFVFVVYMAAMFAAVFTTFDIAADYESGFGHRMMLAAPRRLAIVGGYVMVSFWRGLLNVVVVFAIALATGMPVKGDALDIAALIVLAVLLNVATTLYGAGIALRFQKHRLRRADPDPHFYAVLSLSDLYPPPPALRLVARRRRRQPAHPGARSRAGLPGRRPRQGRPRVRSARGADPAVLGLGRRRHAPRGARPGRRLLAWASCAWSPRSRPGIVHVSSA